MSGRPTRHGCALRMNRLNKLMRREIHLLVPTSIRHGKEVGKRPTIQKAIQAHRDLMVLKRRWRY